MPDLLLELLTEEIPARMQAAAARDIVTYATTALQVQGISSKNIASFITPRRLTLVVEGLPKTTEATSEERRGPRVGAPGGAVQGFLKSVGLASLDQCETRATDKGEFYFAMINRPGVATKKLLPVALGVVISSMTWPKSMRFPAADFRWVRPLTRVLSLFDGEVLEVGNLDLSKIKVDNKTEGHRFLSEGTLEVSNFADYRAKLKVAHVILDANERRALIESELTQKARKAGYTVKDDSDLLNEVVGLVEWPVVLMGSVDDDFMVLPAEVLATSMRKHQKYFTCLDQKREIAPHFLMVSNMITPDKGRVIIAGNERVLRARLSDAKFFWDQDRKVSLELRLPKLKERVFHASLGSVLEKVGRVKALAESIAQYVGADSIKVSRAAELVKADLSSSMVGEFPELQGIMGGYYASHGGEAREVVTAIGEHYSPLGPNDRCPTAPVSVAVALADKLDTLAGFFVIKETPTGSKDPFALRRAALGVIRLIVENKLRLPLIEVLSGAVEQARASALMARMTGNSIATGISVVVQRQKSYRSEPIDDVVLQLLDFFADRLKVALREKGTRHDLVSSVFALGGEDDLVRLLARVEALDQFLKSEAGVNLLAAYKRAANILRIEEKKDSVTYSGVPRPDLLVAAEERALDKALGAATTKSGAALKAEDFAGAMAALASLRGPVDAFFAKVTVNDPDKELRENRLRLLSQIRDTLNLVADFAQVEG